MVSVIVSSAVDLGLSPGRLKPKTMKFIFVASPQSAQHWGERVKTVRIGIGIMCPSGGKWIPVASYLSELTLEHSGPLPNLIKN